MSYLPRMSKTYKEPQESFYEELEDSVSFNTIKPASSLLNEKTYNPQMILRHYKYLPHAPPVLPGPSVVEELREHELYREAGRLKRSSSKAETPPKATEVVTEQSELVAEESEICLAENESDTKAEEKTKRSHVRKSLKGKSGVGRKRSGKSLKKSSQSKFAVNMCLTETVMLPSVADDPKARKALGDSESLSSGEVHPHRDISLEERREATNRSVQCAIFGSLEKSFVVPTIINSLLRTLAFLLREMNREEALSNMSAEKKSFLTQIQLILGDLCNQKVAKEFGFDMSYSDFKRLEKIFGELQKYMKGVYGDKGEYIDKMEDLRKIFLELKKKELELAFLSEKLQEVEEKTLQDVVVRDSDLKNSEITLQNKRLESEQLAAEAEFSYREVKECQKTIAEVDWEIRDLQEQIVGLKKSAASRTKAGVLMRKNSILKVSADMLIRGCKESDKKKT